MCDSQENLTQKKKCIACGELIAVEAHICVHCKSSQDWTRYLNFGSTTLALLTALVSVSATGLPIIKKAITPDNSDLKLVFQGFDADDGAVMLLAHNSGTKPGGLGRSYIKYIPLQNGVFINYINELALIDKSPQGSLVEEGKSKQFRLKLTNHGIDPLSHGTITVSPKDITCRFVFETAEFIGASKSITFEKNCEEAFSYIVVDAGRANKSR